MQLYLAADDADGVAIQAGWSLMAFCSLAARLHDLSWNGAISLAMGLGGFGCIFELQCRFAADGGGLICCHQNAQSPR